MEWVEVKGPSIEVAVSAALEELGLSNAEEAEVEVIQEPEKGFLGVGRKEAVVRVKTKPKQQRRRRRGRGGRGKGGGQGSGQAGDGRGEGRNQGQNKGQTRGQRENGGRQGADDKDKVGARGKRPSAKGKPGNAGQRGQQAPRAERTQENGATVTDETPAISAEEREAVVKEFLGGVVEAFDLEGSVDVRTEEDIVFADVTGDQTEALVGQRGAVMQALHELTRTVVQRQTQEGVRLRLDVAGYASRRREALSIYANRLISQLREEGGGEVMLEPMNPADRKVIHDAVAEVDDAESFSEGEEPRRSVVISVPSTD